MPGFKADAGKKNGLEIWRVEKMDVELIDPRKVGQFHTGDCYLVLHTYDKKGQIYQDLHFWLGSTSSQDEQGVAAYKTVELDDKLGGKPVQYREVQGFESPLFLTYFPNGLQYLEGGIESGFNHVEPNKYTPRLFHVKGKRTVRCQQVEFKATSLNDGDVFILDAGLTIYQWNGKEANKYEKFKGLEMATKIKDGERGGKAKLITLDSGRNDDAASADAAEFWKKLGGSRSDIKSSAAGGDDEGVKATPAALFKVSDATGKVVVSEVGRGKLEKKMLDATDVFLLDTGTQIFVWVGKGATKQERDKGMSHATQYLKDNGRPNTIPITRVPGGGEPPVFKSYFLNFDKEPLAEAAAASSSSSSSSSSSAPKKIDTSALFKKSVQASEKMLDTKGKVEVWRIENLAKVAVAPADYGHFSSGDSYIVLYSYKQGQKDAWIIYFWQGHASSSDEKGASALLAVALDDSLGGEPVQVRVVEGKEPAHFLALFQGKMVVHKGGVKSGFANRKDGDSGVAPVRLYHVRGTTRVNTRAVEVDAKATSLNSGDSFCLITPSSAIAWSGKYSNNDEKAIVLEVTHRLAESGGAKRAVSSVNEGSEPASFWTDLGGKAAYPSTGTSDDVEEPRLFQVSSHGGVEEVVNYTQDDLMQDAVFLLDLKSEVFVWVGKDARREDKDLALTTALNFVKAAPDGRSADTPVFKVHAGNEPPVFTCHFHGWDSKKAEDFSDPYLKKLGLAPGSSSSSSASAAASVERVSAGSVGYSDAGANKHSLAALKAGTPAGVDPAHKEHYLADDEFKATLGHDRAAFAALAGWKQSELKKKAGIF